jgi:hypothetical protein
MEAISGVRKAFSIKPGYCFRAYLGSQCLALRKRIIIKHQSCDKFSVICEQKKQMVIGELRFFYFRMLCQRPFLNGSDVSLCAVAAPGKTGRAIMMIKKSGFLRPFIV